MDSTVALGYLIGSPWASFPPARATFFALDENSAPWHSNRPMDRKGTRPRVLVVEDDERLVMAIKDTLAYEGYETRAARNGRDAIDVLGSGFSPDVLVLDLMMPIATGFEVVAWLQGRGMDVPIVLSTQKDDVAASDVGAVLKLSKPFTAEQLLDGIAHALTRTSAADLHP
jgi:DNA-binding response OmpR family regulator